MALSAVARFSAVRALGWSGRLVSNDSEETMTRRAQILHLMSRRRAVTQRWRVTALLSALLVMALAGCGLLPGAASAVRQPDARGTAQTVITPTTRPRPAILFGAAVQFQALQADQQYRRLVRDDFTLVAPENDMKIGVVEPQQGRFDFSHGDAIVAFAQANGLWVRGHTLVWGQDQPGWLVNGHFTRAQATAILKTYITTVVGHYKGQVVAWDVVNEAMDGSQLANTFWLRAIGPDYIKLAFEWAHQADPNAELFYNDWGDDVVGAKFDAILALVSDLRSQGIPVDGVGMESHIGFGAPFQPRDVATNMRRLKAAGLDVEISEIDVQVGGLPGDTAAKLREQADIYGQTAAICKAAGNCRSYTVWGVSDRYSWLIPIVGPNQAPLLFDANYQPKPAYAAVVQALGGN